MTLEEESEIGAMYVIYREVTPQIIELIEMGYTILRTPMKTDNLDIYSFVTKNIQPIRTKATDMRFH